MQIQEIKNLRFLGQIREILIYSAGDGKWFLAVETTLCGHVKLFTAKGSLRLFTTLDAANASALKILNVQPSHLLDEPLKAQPFVRIIN